MSKIFAIALITAIACLLGRFLDSTFEERTMIERLEAAYNPSPGSEPHSLLVLKNGEVIPITAEGVPSTEWDDRIRRYVARGDREFGKLYGMHRHKGARSIP